MAIDGRQPLKQEPAEIEKMVLEKLAVAPRGKQAYGSMVTLITAGEKTGNADSLFGDFIQGTIFRLFQFADQGAADNDAVGHVTEHPDMLGFADAEADTNRQFRLLP